MNQSISIQNLTQRLNMLELELRHIRQVLQALPNPQIDELDDLFVNKTPLQEQIQKLFQTLAIEGESVGAVALQEQMTNLQLTPNELSQTIITMREE